MSADFWWNGQLIKGTPNTAQQPGAVAQQPAANPYVAPQTSAPQNVAAPVAQPGGASNPSSVFGSNGYTFDVNKYLDPSMKFTMDQGMRAIGSSASAGGQTFAGNTLRGIMDYSQGLAGQNWNNAFQQGVGQQNFARGVDVSNRQMGQTDTQLANQATANANAFSLGQGNLSNQASQIANQNNQFNANLGYQQQLNDQTIPWQQQYQMAQLGMQGLGQQSSLAGILAQIQGGNAANIGQVEGTGTIGGSNAINDSLSKILQNLTQNKQYDFYNNLMPNRA